MSHSKIISVRAYLIAYLLLMGLLVITIVANMFVSSTWDFFIAMLIALVKMLIIATIFMELRVHSHLTSIFAVAGLLWLAIFIGLTFGDYKTRSWTNLSMPIPVSQSNEIHF